MEQLSAGAVKFEAWDLGGQDTLRSYWSYVRFESSTEYFPDIFMSTHKRSFL